MVQRPEEKPGVALVLKGDRGAGKDALGDYFSPILGRHAFKLTKSDSLTGRFNRHLGEMIFLHVEEGFWAGDKAAESTLKSLVTSRELTIEAKGIDAINMPSFVRLFISSNEDWVVPSGHDERRWAVFDVSDIVKQDHDYFAQLFKERDSGGAAALLYVLRDVDLSKFDVRAVPWTQGLIDQKMASLSGVEAWWQEVLAEGQLPMTLGDWEADEVAVARQSLREAYNRWAKENPKLGRGTTVEHFGRSLHKLVPDIRDTRAPRDAGRTWQYVLPPLSECRDAFDQRFGA
jgi:phage/plasmid-associated DNA primase